MEQENEVVIDAGSLQGCLHRLGRLAGRVCGAGIWEFSEDRLALEWSGSVEVLETTGTFTERIRVEGPNMRGLGRLKLGTGSVRLRVDDGRLFLGTLSMPCIPVSEVAESVLPAFATQRDLVLAMHRHSRADLLAAGHARELRQVEEKVATSVERAAKALAWLGIDEYDVNRWVQAELRSVAEGGPGYHPPHPEPPAPRLIVVDKRDQLELLTDRE